MLPKDYINYRLTGVHSCDYSDASGMLLLDVKNKCWSEKMMKICCVEREQLPSIRELSALLGVNPNTIQKAFQELDRNGIIVSGQGRGCFVSDKATLKIKEKLSVKITEIESIASELARAGIEEEKLISAIRRAYADIQK